MTEYHVRRLIGRLAQWQHCMSYNDSYFGEPAGLVKQVTAELVRAVDPIYPPMPEPVNPFSNVVIHTATGSFTPNTNGTTPPQPADGGDRVGELVEAASKVLVAPASAGGMDWALDELRAALAKFQPAGGES